MEKEFIKELAELINKHGLEKEMRDTPGYISAQGCADAMAVFSEAMARRDISIALKEETRKEAENETR